MGSSNSESTRWSFYLDYSPRLVAVRPRRSELRCDHRCVVEDLGRAGRRRREDLLFSVTGSSCAVVRVSTSVDVSDAWQLRVTLMRPHTALGLPLLRSSVVGTARTGCMHRTIVAGAGAGGRVPVVLRVSRSAFGHGDLVLVVRALNQSGTVATLLVPLQNAPSVAGCS